MPESVADKTPISTIERHHIDPPGLWIAILIASVALHSVVLWLMFSSKLNLMGRRPGARAIPIQVVEVVPRTKTRARPRVIAQKPKVESKLQPTKPIQVKPQSLPQIKPQPNQPAINPVQKNQTEASQPGTIAFTKTPPVKKPNKSPSVQNQQKQRSLPPLTPKVEKKVALDPLRPPKTEPKKPNIQKPKPLQTLAEQRRQQLLAEKLRQQQLAEQQRQQQEAEQRRLQELAEQRRQQQAEQRQQQLAEQQRQQQLAEQRQQLSEQQRQQELAEQRQQEAEQRRQQEAEQQRQQLAEQQRQQLAEQRRQQEAEQRRTEEVARNQGKVPIGSPVEIAGNAPSPFPTEPTPIPTPTSRPAQAPASADSTTATGGFGAVNLTFLDDEQQKTYNGIGKGTTLKVPPRRQPTTKIPKKPTLDEKDKKLVTKEIKCLVVLGIDANGKIFESEEGINAKSDETQTRELCQRYAKEYFNLNKDNMKFIPGQDIDGRPAAGYMLTQITIEPAAPSPVKN